MPILKIEKTLNKEAGKIKRIIHYQCDSCDKQFTRPYKKAQVEKNKKYTYCKKDCYYKSRSKGGKDYKKRLQSGTLSLAGKRMNEITKERYGAHSSQLDFVKRKVKKTHEEKYGGVGFASKKLAKKSHEKTLKLYGVEHALQSDEIKENQRKTNKKKYGYDHVLQVPEIKKKAEKTNMKRYGGKKPMCASKVRNKQEQTCIKRYGVRNYSQTQEFADMNIWDKYHVTGHIQFMNKQIYYRSSYEKRFLEWCVKNIHIIKDITPNISFKYFRKSGKQHIYFADFLIEFNTGKHILYEIKPQTFVNSELNQAKFKAVRQQLKEKNIDKFIIITENELAYLKHG